MWTKSQKISGGLLGIAVVAFAVDRWVLSPSEDAAAAVAPSAEVEELAIRPASRGATSPRTTAAARTASAAQSTATLANRLSSLAASRHYQYVTTADAFRASDDWLAQAKKAESTDSPGETAAATSPTDESRTANPTADFTRRHTLSAVMNSKAGGGMAIVNGKLYEVGRAIDGFKLVKVGVADATFEKGGHTVTLRLPGQLPPVAQIE